jgi:DNA-binding XRE family transcriptional regulator
MTGHTPFSRLRDRMRPAARAEAERLADKLRAEMPLHSLRRALELSQAQLAETLELDQPGISRLEKQTDMLVSTLGRYITAMGGRLEMRAVFPTGEVTISGLGAIRKPAGRARSRPAQRSRPRRARGGTAAPAESSH